LVRSTYLSSFFSSFTITPKYEALRNGDILACEDTRKTGKLLELVQLKKMKEKIPKKFLVILEIFIVLPQIKILQMELK
jgi:hypothetical protein